MDKPRFDLHLLTRAVTGSTSRRAGLAGALTAVLPIGANAAPAAEACVANGRRCGKGSGKRGEPCRTCCSRHGITQRNGRRHCACKPAGTRATNAAQRCAGERSAGGVRGACDPGLTGCPDGCADLATDAANCGACGNACAARQPGADGVCLCTPFRQACSSADRCCSADGMTGCARSNIFDGDVCCSALGGACTTCGPSGDCCVVALNGQNASDYAYCSPGRACGGQGATCRFDEACASGACSTASPSDDSGACAGPGGC